MENEAGYSVNTKGAIDLHNHPFPCNLPRLSIDREITKVYLKQAYLKMKLPFQS